MSELRDAAERLRQVERNAEAGDPCWISSVYEFASPRPIATYREDHRQICGAYLAEHHADGELPVTGTWWLATFGVHHVPISCDFRLYHHDDYGVCLHAEGSEKHSSDYQINLPAIKTRDDVRALCRLLGIQLNERKDEP